MHFSKKNFIFFILTFCLNTALAGEEVIYQWKDNQGEVYFSDQPNQNATILQLPELQTYHVQSISKSESSSSSSKEEIEKFAYKSLKILRPKNLETIQNNQGNVIVTIYSHSSINKSNYYQIWLDGKVYKKQINNSCILRNINRGEHSLKVVILNEQEKILIQSKKVIFYMHRATKNKKAQEV